MSRISAGVSWIDDAYGEKGRHTVCFFIAEREAKV